MSDTAERIRTHRLVMIFRGQSPRECLDIGVVLYQAGVRLFEVTMNSPRPLDAIRLLRAEFGADVCLGAGTVLAPAEVDQVAEAGAGFVISPNTDEAVIAATTDAGLVSIPGALTPTEIVRAVRAGADFVKVFPLRPVGADYLRQVRAPLPDVPIIATGGVDVALAREAMAAGCVGVGIGVHLLGERLDDAGAVTEQAGRFLDAVGRGSV
jgi:2-dehydro-3-deoxyphosphogluconate aldolase/(4S)-4-hydroxy-2-oxoglutarate aldolase